MFFRFQFFKPSDGSVIYKNLVIIEKTSGCCKTLQHNWLLEQDYYNLSAKERNNSKTKETKKLQTDQAKENKMYASLKQKEQKLKKDQKAQQKRANELNARIQKLIAEEIKKEEERARQKASQEGKQETAPQYVMSKEEQLIAGNFEKNKGKLPLPVEKGFVSGNFGIQPHPVLSHVTTNNKGIYIQTPSGSDARAIFEGVVTAFYGSGVKRSYCKTRHLPLCLPILPKFT